jgi:two-component sensor histidine kinase
MVEPGRGRPYCEVVFRPSHELITVIRRFVSNFFGDTLADDGVAQRLSLATHELLENAVRYSTDGEARLRIELLSKPPTGEHVAVIRTFNKTTPDQIEKLKEAFEGLATPDARALYTDLIRRRQGLGLARIQAEAELSLNLDVEDDQVCVIAHARVKPRED